MKNSIVKGLAFIFLSFTSCVTEKISPEKQTFAGQEYFPYMLNEERIYEIYEINYTNFGTDTTHYFQKEVITSISEEENETRYYTNVYSAPKLDSAFTIEEIYSITVKEKQIIETKNNVVNLIVVLPITKNLQFDRNLYNAEKTAYTTVKSLNENKSYSDFLATRSFENILDLEKEKSFNTIEEIYKHQVYEKEKGLVYELDQNINKQPNANPIGHKNLKIRVL